MYKLKQLLNEVEQNYIEILQETTYLFLTELSEIVKDKKVFNASMHSECITLIDKYEIFLERFETTVSNMKSYINTEEYNYIMQFIPRTLDATERLKQTLTDIYNNKVKQNKLEEAFDLVKKILSPYLNLFTNLVGPFSTSIKDLFKGIYKSQAGQDTLKTLAYSNPITAALYDNKDIFTNINNKGDK